jgi:AraC-like DNA-binding protein
MISSIYIKLVLRELKFDSSNLAVLFENTDINVERIGDIDYISNQSFDQFLCNAFHYSTDSTLALKFGQHCGVLTSGIVGKTAIAAPTLIKALRIFSDSSRIHASAIRIDVELGSDYFRIKCYEEEHLGESRIHQLEVTILIIQNFIETIIGDKFIQGQYGMPFSPPDDLINYKAFFNSPISFNTPVTYVDIPKELALIANPFIDIVLWESGKRQIAQLISENTTNNKLFTSYILSYLHTSHPPLVSIRECAKSLFVSERTLSRRLASEGVNYRQLQEKVLSEQSLHYLKSGKDTIENIAFKLGYKDCANFRRAFKRWFKCSPQKYLNNQVSL